MIDIDRGVLELAKSKLQAFHFDSWKDSRLNLVVDDVYSFVEEKIREVDDGKLKSEDLYDVVIMDICDPTEGTFFPTMLFLTFFSIHQ